MDKIKKDKINSIYNTNCIINIKKILDKPNLKKKKKIIFNEYVKERIKNNNINYIGRNKRPIENNKNCDYIINFSTNNIYCHNKSKYTKKPIDNSHQFIICEYSKLSHNSYKDNYNDISTNYYNNYTQKTINTTKNRYPLIIVSKKTKGKIKYIRNNNLEKIIKLQAFWRGYYLRKMAIGGIKKYIGFIALIKYIQKIYIKREKILFFFYLKRCKISSNNSKEINMKKYCYKTIKERFYNNKYENEQTKIKFYNNQINEKLKFNLSSINKESKSNNKKTFIYKPKKISTYLFNINKNLYKNRNLYKYNIKAKIKFENVMTNLNKICIYKIYHSFLYKFKKYQKTSILNQKMKQIINSIEKDRIKKIFNKFRENIMNIKIKEEFYKSKNVNINSDNNDNRINELNNKEINNTLLKSLINKKIERITNYYKNLLSKYFNIWVKKSINIFERSDSCLTTRTKSKKKYIKLKYNHDLSFKTDSSFISEQREKSISINNNKNNNHKKVMKLKSIIISKNKSRNMIGSNFNFEPRIQKMHLLINKIDDKKILNKYFVFWQKDN